MKKKITIIGAGMMGSALAFPAAECFRLFYALYPRRNLPHIRREEGENFIVVFIVDWPQDDSVRFNFHTLFSFAWFCDFFAWFSAEYTAVYGFLPFTEQVVIQHIITDTTRLFKELPSHFCRTVFFPFIPHFLIPPTPLICVTGKRTMQDGWLGNANLQDF